jgi:hypothetical protein
MLRLPIADNSLLVRTTFSDKERWEDALSVVLKENEDGFRAYVDVVDDSAWDGVIWERILGGVRREHRRRRRVQRLSLTVLAAAAY